MAGPDVLDAELEQLSVEIIGEVRMTGSKSLEVVWAYRMPDLASDA